MIRRNALYFAWVIAFAGAILSLYFGEIQQIEPCHLCWYQRIFLFPLAILLGIAAYRGDRGIVLYALPLAILGALFALYQTFEPHVPFLRAEALCGEERSCTEPVFLIEGFLSFPLVSAIGFLLITIFLWIARK